MEGFDYGLQNVRYQPVSFTLTVMLTFVSSFSYAAMSVIGVAFFRASTAFTCCLFNQITDRISPQIESK